MAAALGRVVHHLVDMHGMSGFTGAQAGMHFPTLSAHITLGSSSDTASRIQCELITNVKNSAHHLLPACKPGNHKLHDFLCPYLMLRETTLKRLECPWTGAQQM